MKTQKIPVKAFISFALAFTSWAGCNQTKTNKELSRIVREVYLENINHGKVDVIDKYYAPEFVAHPVGEDDIKGPEAYKQYLKGAFSVLPDFNVTIEDMVTEGDSVAFRWTLRGTQKGPFLNIPASGKKVEIECISFYRANKDGKFVEKNFICDNLGLLQQLGAIPAK